MARTPRYDVSELLPSDRPKRGTLAQRVSGAIIGGAVGAGLGFGVLLVVFGWLGGDGQAGLGALFIGAPIGGWLGAVVGIREATS